MSSSANDFHSNLSSPSSEQKFERPQSYTFSTISKGTNSVQTAHPTVIYESSKTIDTPTRVIGKEHNAVISFYQSLSWMFGFREKFSLLLFWICGGALLGFCLARAFLMNLRIMVEQTVPGEFRWFNLSLYRVNYIIHIYMTIIGGMLVGLQFLPAIRRKSVLLHRLNGYTCLGLLIVGNICGGIISRRSFGGEINSQSAYYILAIMLIFSGLMGYYQVKRDTRKHRKWMLRSVVYFSVIISARLIMLAARQIVTEIGTYYSLWRCDEVFFVLQDKDTLLQMFPQCASENPNDNGLYVPVHASVHEGNLGLASAVRVVQGMTLWVATIIHMALVEIYIQSTESLNFKRHGFVLEPQDFDSEAMFLRHNSNW